MKILTWGEFGWGWRRGGPIAAAIGVFDGLHIGHRELIGRVIGRSGLASMVVTFEQNPKLLLSPSTFHGELSTLNQKLSLIDSMGVDLCVLIDFSGDFSKLPGRQFLSMLSASGELRFLAVGSDFRCGHRLDTDAEGIRGFYAERSVDVELLSAVHWAGHTVSSSRIRRAILEGRLEDAAQMLGRPFEIDLRGARASASGRLFPTGGQASPPPASYEALVVLSAGESTKDLRADGTRSESRVAAHLDAEGAWSFFNSGAHGSIPIGLRLLHMVSRE
jgi:riboflavin kinase / FMN adenylyltransferase